MRTPQHVRLTQLDGALPNLALMKLSHWHRSKGDHVHLTRQIYPTLLEPEYDLVYGSSIFQFSAKKYSQRSGTQVLATWG